MNVTVIGVAGGTGSGKSTLVKRLQEAFVGDDVVTLCHDYYYKAHPELTYEERTKLNYDHPQAFDTEMLVEHIKACPAVCSLSCAFCSSAKFSSMELIISAAALRIVSRELFSSDSSRPLLHPAT